MANRKLSEFEKEWCEAEDMRDFWEVNAVGKLEKAQREIEELRYELLSKYKDDNKAINEIVFKLDALIDIAKKRFKHWDAKYNEFEDYSSLAEDDEDDTPYEPYDCVLDPVPEPFDYVAMGMGV